MNSCTYILRFWQENFLIYVGAPTLYVYIEIKNYLVDLCYAIKICRQDEIWNLNSEGAKSFVVQGNFTFEG